MLELDVAPESIIERDPAPVLLLRGFSAPPPAAVAELTFEYGAHVVELSAEKPDAFESTERGRTVLWPGVTSSRLRRARALDEYGLHLVGSPGIQYVEHKSSTLRFPLPDERRWVRFLGQYHAEAARARLADRIDPSFPYELIDDADWDAQIGKARTAGLNSISASSRRAARLAPADRRSMRCKRWAFTRPRNSPS